MRSNTTRFKTSADKQMYSQMYINEGQLEITMLLTQRIADSALLSPRGRVSELYCGEVLITWRVWLI